MTVNSFLPRIVVAEKMSYVGEFPNVATTTGGPPLTQKSLTRFPLPWFLAYVRASVGFSR